MIEPWTPKPRRTKAARAPTAKQLEQRRAYARKLCRAAHDTATWQAANRWAALWNCGDCVTLGVKHYDQTT